MQLRGSELAYVSSKTCGRMLGVSRQRVQQLLSEGKLSGCVVDGRWVISSRSVEARMALLKQEAEEYAASG
jgi:predicted DNA-binding protein (UPF0251 family)